MLIMKFVPDVEAEIINAPGLQTNLSEKWCYCAKVRALYKKQTVPLKDFFK